MSTLVQVTHGVVCSVDEGIENYFGWPSVAQLADGTIVAGSSGLRAAHVCPWGKSVLCYSSDNGATYGAVQVVHNDLIDNRDLGVIALSGQKFAVTWFSLDIRTYQVDKILPPDLREKAAAYMASWQDDTVRALMGSWMKITEDGGQTWTRPIRVPVSAPHGFSVMKNGELGYLGKRYHEAIYGPVGNVEYHVSSDGGYTWQLRGTVPIPEENISQYHEPHVIELMDGSLIGTIRYHKTKEEGGGLDTCLTFSRDGGMTWTAPERMHIMGSPPHLLRHSSGAIVLTYGYREKKYGQRARVSWDEGKTWSDPIILRDDGETTDLGYPCSIELGDGSIYTVYYQALPGKQNTSILWTKWNIPKGE